MLARQPNRFFLANRQRGEASVCKQQSSRARCCHAIPGVKRAVHVLAQRNGLYLRHIHLPRTLKAAATASSRASADAEARGPKDEQDDEASFSEWLSGALSASPGYATYPEIYAEAHDCVLRWRRRYRGDKPTWQRLMKRERLVKELGEAAPVIARVRAVVEALPEGKRATIVDLCSGKGYLSMFLSEMLPAEKVTRCLLVDRAWPRCGAECQQHHINWDHIYGPYWEQWPIRLHTSKQNIKKGRTLREMHARLLDPASEDGPVLLLAVHLCGTLSLRAIQLFAECPNVELLALKPCCLPGMVHAKRKETFSAGPHTFDATEVCAPGRWASTGSTARERWDGPPRAHLAKRFRQWTAHLGEGVAKSAAPDGWAELESISVHKGGGYQDLYIWGGTCDHRQHHVLPAAAYHNVESLSLRPSSSAQQRDVEAGGHKQRNARTAADHRGVVPPELAALERCGPHPTTSQNDGETREPTTMARSNVTQFDDDPPETTSMAQLGTPQTVDQHNDTVQTMTRRDEELVEPTSLSQQNALIPAGTSPPPSRALPPSSPSAEDSWTSRPRALEARSVGDHLATWHHPQFHLSVASNDRRTRGTEWDRGDHPGAEPAESAPETHQDAPPAATQRSHEPLIPAMFRDEPPAAARREDETPPRLTLIPPRSPWLSDDPPIPRHPIRLIARLALGP
ncbi:hypothetical protein CYMTET_8274 [Cymbomonas tetramitiformis]|uniref:Methyltransferase domain-containing protein n=1 Tax=Cymbomonas tetramitiformis TaxID=36881 RepID=A0AAE0LG86_9CHLO|nr:hypothetical protein CYMTET_8274 [Cymbomonas tetramitiformis]